MAGKSVSFNSHCDLTESQLDSVARWLSCNGEVWGMGPTAVFASAAALFLYNELQATLFEPGDHVRVPLMEKTLVSTMILGMLALMVHLWVCSMRFFQYYLDTLIKDSPSMLLEMTTAGLLGSQSEIFPLGPLMRFLRQQQPQIHITVCWFLSLCYADYVRKHYCRRFNMPYLDQWWHQAGRAARARLPRAALHHGQGEQFRGRRAPAAAGLHTTSSARATQHDCGRTYSGGVSPRRASPVEVSRATSRVSWAVGPGRPGVPGAPGQCTPRQEMSVRLVGQSSETTADAIEKLRAFVKQTRCPCGGAPDAGGGCSGAATPKGNAL